MELYSISRNGQLCIWDCDTELDGLVEDDGTKEDSESESEEGSEEQGDGVKKKKKKKKGREKLNGLYAMMTNHQQTNLKGKNL